MKTEYDKANPVKISDHFSSKEFNCPCSSCSKCIIDTDILPLLERLRESLGQPIKITSGYRCSDYQRDLRLRGYETSTGISTHELGQAVDLVSKGKTGAELSALARIAGFTSVGVGQNFIHVDLRPGFKHWTYSY